MTRIQDSQAGNISHTHESRQYPRRKLVGIAYVELAQDNGGILLNLSEGGLAVQSALVLSSQEFPELRFQLPHMRGWLTARGRVAWLSESKKEAGIQFLDLHEHARAQIRVWLGQDEDEPPLRNEEIGAGVPPTAASDPTNRGERKNGGHASPLGNTERPSPGRDTETSAVPARSVVNTSAQPVAATAQDDLSFRFHDYSMFAADDRAGVPWVEPPRSKRSWGSFVLFTVLLAALFFVLGAMIGRDNLNGIVASVGSWKEIQGQAPPNVKPPSPPEQSVANTPSDQQGTSETNPSGGQANQSGSNGQNAAQGLSGTEQENAQQTSKAEPNEGKGKARDNDGPEAASKTEAALTADGKTASNVNVEKSSKTERRDASYSNPDSTEPSEYGRSILVNPPAPGSPPIFVSLPGEAVSASSSVAISARRSIQVPPRVDGDAYNSERVMIGKLMAHSDPFYPLEARNKRVEGIVELHAVVGRSGQVISVTPVSGPPILVPAGVTALREWRYAPTFINGDPVETHVDVTMVFRSP